jgi:hypothetical protein
VHCFEWLRDFYKNRGREVSDTRSGPGKQKKISCKEQLYSEWKKLKGRPISQR